MRRRHVTSIAAACLALPAIAGCGNDDGGAAARSPAPKSQQQSRPNVSTLTDGCRPRQTATIVSDFFAAAYFGREGEALGYVAPRHELIGLALYSSADPGEAGTDLRTPHAVYQRLSGLISPYSPPRLLVAATGPTGPFEGDTRWRTAPGDKAGVEFIVGLGSHSFSGKVGIACGGGRIYSGAGHLERGLKKQRHCGEYIRLDARRPVICTIGGEA